jgi:hypothetical protein
MIMNLSQTWFYTLALTGVILTGAITAPNTHAQRVVNINPALNGKNISPETSISGVFDSSGGTVAPQSVKIYLNDNNVTNESTITENFFSYKPSQPLPLGNNIVRVEYQNTQGQSKIVSWSFNVQRTSAALEISSVTHNATKPLGKGATFLATIEGTPGAIAKVLLVEDGQPLVTIPAEEVSSGVYVATYNLNRQSSTQGIVVGSLQKNNETIYDAATQGFAFNNQVDSTEAPQVGLEPTRSLQPVFTNFQNGDQVSTTGFTLQGETQPKATVEIEVSSKLPVLGGIINIDLGGKTFFEQKVTADDQGKFQISVPAPAGLAPGMKYTVKAIASHEGKKSQPVELNLVQQ